jgi:hypothetical protein
MITIWKTNKIKYNEIGQNSGMVGAGIHNFKNLKQTKINAQHTYRTQMRLAN